MRRTILLAATWTAAIALLAGMGSIGGCAPTRQHATVTIFNTGDIHENTRNLARISRFVSDRRKGRTNVLFVDAGDRFNKGDTPIMYTRGEAVTALMAACGYDAVAIGNHDTAFGTERLAELAERFPLPLLAANCRWPEEVDPGVAPPYKLFRLKGVTVAVIGTASEYVNHRSDDRLEVRPADDGLAELVRRVRREADVVVLLTHVDDGRDLQIARAVPGVDLIVGGHSHSRHVQMILDRPSRTIILKSGWGGANVGEIVFNWDGTRLVDCTARTHSMTKGMPEDAKVKALWAKYFDAMSPNKRLAEVPKAMSATEWTAWLARAVAEDLGADAVLMPAGAVRAGLKAGAFTPSMLKAIPRLAVVRFNVPGPEQLKEVLAKACAGDPSVVAFEFSPPSGISKLRVAYPCVAFDKMLPADRMGLAGRNVSGFERVRDRSLWQIAVEAARRSKTIAAPSPQRAGAAVAN